jgi:hypothetical protein
MSLLFTLGYIGIFVEEIVGLNKSGVALLMAVSLWTIYSDGAGGPVRPWLLVLLLCACPAAAAMIMHACMCSQLPHAAASHRTAWRQSSGQDPAHAACCKQTGRDCVLCVTVCAPLGRR